MISYCRVATGLTHDAFDAERPVKPFHHFGPEKMITRLAFVAGVWWGLTLTPKPQDTAMLEMNAALPI